jgi:hypothetical protein
MRCRAARPVVLLACLTGITHGIGRGDDATPAGAVVAVDEAFAASVNSLVERAARLGDDRLAALIADWQMPEPSDRQCVVAIPARLERPAWIGEGAAAVVWEDFIAARRRRAADTFEQAVTASRAHRRVARITPRDAGDEAAAPVPQRSAAAWTLVFRTLRDDPDHSRARAAAGWVRQGDGWAWPQAARRIARGEVYDADLGWLPRGRLERYRRGDRYDRGRWLSAAEDAARVLDVANGRRFDSDHWEILSPAPLEAAAALAARLEETYTVWQQVFGTIGMAPADLERRLVSRPTARPVEPFAAVLCVDRKQYIAELGHLEPSIARADGIYWTPTRTAWFFHVAGDGVEKSPRADTVHHEATHQLCLEAGDASRTSPLAGERCGFWVIEALACHMESIRPTEHGWTVGGADAGRVPEARSLLEAGVHVPLAEFAALGRTDFQTHPRLEDLYAEAAGWANFFLNAEEGRYREAFLTYAARVYAGTADPDTLARLCRVSFADLEASYRVSLRAEAEPPHEPEM